MSPPRHDRRQGEFAFDEIERSEMGRRPHALPSMLDQHLDGLIVRGLFPREVVDEVAARLERAAFPRRDFGSSEAGSYSVGHAIVGASNDLGTYFADAGPQRERVRRLFDGLADFEATVAGALGTLAGGVPVEVAREREGRECPFATIRVLRDGGEIGLHVDNAYLHMPNAAHLRALVDPVGQLSYFVTLSAPDGGGELEVFGLEWAAARLFMGAPEGASANVWFAGSEVATAISGFGSTKFRTSPGDLLVFDGGRYFHRVATVQGAVPRRTIGGFLGLSPGRDRVFVWS